MPPSFRPIRSAELFAFLCKLLARVEFRREKATLGAIKRVENSSVSRVASRAAKSVSSNRIAKSMSNSRVAKGVSSSRVAKSVSISREREH